jgi:hypothetical protein
MATKMKCPNGQAWDTKLKKCVELDDPMQNLYGYSTKGGVNWYGEDSPSTVVRGSKPMIRGARETAEKMAEILKKKSKMGGATKKTYKTGGMVNANAKLAATKSAGSKGVKSGVNPKAAASSTAKKPSAARSKAPKKAMPKAKYGMTMKKSC